MRLPPRNTAGARLGGGQRWALLLLVCASCGGEQRWAELGDFATSRGEVIRDCRLSYRTYGRLDAQRSNAVLVTPWFLGTSSQVGRQIGPGRLVDDSRFFVIAVDPLGNGVSSSPSNSRLQPGATFPRLTISDLVRSQGQLLTHVLGISHLRAVVGASMGGMQALDWAATEPGFADAVVSIVGSPRSSDRDRRYWENASAVVRSTRPWQRVASALGRLAPVEAIRELQTDPEDFLLQAGAIQTLDLTSTTGGSMERLAAEVRARLLVIVSEQDDIVDPTAARELARLTGAELLVLAGRCGHQAPQCERSRVLAAVQRFLEPKPGTSSLSTQH
jgi:homoserine O-acetyltransferase